ncbi:MAG: phosphohistidine phosphatase SixA [Planctomycetes bacterium]|nr:phosphohistidine phosphatase SixA [Planctomycetota bacterium]
MMDLIVVRHADAEHETRPDFDRKLTLKGEKQSARIGKFLAALGVWPDRIITSPLVRARQTADLAAALLKPEKGVEVDERLACGMQPDDVYAMLHECDAGACVMIVGHEPDLSRLCSDITAMESSYCFEMKKASVARFELERPGRGGGMLCWLVPPKLHS